MSRTSDIISKAKADIIGFIKHETELISKIYGNDPDEDGIFTESGDWPYSPMIQVPVDNSYLDVEDDIYERRAIERVYVQDDGKVIVETEEGDEIYCENLSVEEIATIADCLEKVYTDIIKK